MNWNKTKHTTPNAGVPVWLWNKDKGLVAGTLREGNGFDSWVLLSGEVANLNTFLVWTEIAEPANVPEDS